MDGEGTDMTVVVRSASLEGNWVDKDDEGRNYYRVDFSRVNLDKGIMMPKFLPSLSSCTGIADMVKLGDHPPTLYIIGGAHYPSEMSVKLRKIKEDRDPQYYTGACRYSHANKVWEHIKLPDFGSTCLQGSVAAMMGKIYCFGDRELKPEVYDPMLDEWKPVSLPSDLRMSSREFSRPVVPDPQKNRILVHLSGGYLYAFYPRPDPSVDGSWECLSEEFDDDDWPDVAAVVDSVLYCHNFMFCNALSAYDIVAGKWLSVSWSDGVYSFRRHPVRGIFRVRPEVLCLAHLCTGPGEFNCDIIFSKISVQRIPPTALLLTPLSYNRFTIPFTETVFDIVPVNAGESSDGGSSWVAGRMVDRTNVDSGEIMSTVPGRRKGQGDDETGSASPMKKSKV